MASINQLKGESPFGSSDLNRFDIMFLQEVWRAEWGGEILFAHGFKHSKGVIILFKPSLFVDIMEITLHKNGRFLVEKHKY